MGTRHLIAAVIDGEFKLAQYGQWDGYPEGQGSDVLAFLRDEMDVGKFTANLRQMFEPTDEQTKDWYLEVGHVLGSNNSMISWDKSKEFSARHPTLSRDTGSKILALVQSATEPLPTRLSQSFAGDSLFCEWAYVIDFDKGIFEVFKGFNTTPTQADSRFPSGAEWLSHTDGYEPVALVKSYPLDSLPTNEGFLSDLREPEEEPEEDAA